MSDIKTKIQEFTSKSLPDAVNDLLQNLLGKPLQPITKAPIKPEDFFSRQFQALDAINYIHLVGLINDEIFKDIYSDTDFETLKKYDKYEALAVFGVDLSSENPSRTILADLTRHINREMKAFPVMVIFKYDNKIAFANAERIDYKQIWREGEKVGKVSLLKDIDIEDTHRGHLSILEQLQVPKSGKKAVFNFSQLYYYWQSIFSISVLNKNFYKEIIKWFNKAIKDIKIPGEIAGSEKHKDFTVRLIARLIFIWFLKELSVVKEKLLIPEFNNGYENDIIKPKNPGTSYYKYILQNLFFNALNKEPSKRNQDLFDVYKADFLNSGELMELIFFSPYLNGGLFDIHPNDWCEVDMVNNAFVVPDHLFLDKDEGINSILSRYKFTIAENTPLEEEIAVDPEMLGRIFENLLAEQNDDTKEAARKNAGAFYTPRPVVSYMCRSTLLKHLDLKIKPENGKQIIHKILNTTVLDPACGSGAFPMGMLEEMMQILETVDPDGNLWVAEMLKSDDEEFKEHISDFVSDNQIGYVKKLGLLRNCLFGIDLLEYAIEITKLRCWLSLIVEQKVDFNKPNYNLKPLPNLEFKFYKKNSLLRFYKNQNLNHLIDSVDKEKSIDELVDLENKYFIARNSTQGNKEEIKQRIITLLERVVDSQSEKVQKELKSAQSTVNYLVSSVSSKSKLNKAKNKVKKLSNELSELAVFRNNIKDYFVERIVFPGIYNKDNKNPGFDIVIGNPPYVNTKQINKMGLTKKLETEYGYCDDLYNHFTIRGKELIKKGGLLCYITSDTFLTLQTKKNIRKELLGVPTITKKGEGLFSNEEKTIPECKLIEIINTPKAFAAFVNTAIFTLKKEKVSENDRIIYVDIRYPTSNTFNISEKEWEQIKTSKENITGWERVLDHTFNKIEYKEGNWVISHTCDGEKVYKDKNSSLLKFKIPFDPFRKAINYAIFSPTPYNCQLLEKIIKPARPVFDKWWDKIETSKKIDKNRIEIQNYITKLKYGDITMLGLLTDGGQGLATGDNGRFVGYKEGSRFAEKCKEDRNKKLFDVILSNPKIKSKWNILSDVETKQDVEHLLNSIKEKEIWKLFEEIKAKYGLRVFGKGFIYRIIPDDLIFDTAKISDKERLEGISGEQSWVPYDKGDREGNRWYLETPYLIDWSEDAVDWLKSNSGKSGAGMPVVRNPQFYFRNGFCWSDVLDPSNPYIKCRLKAKTVNDVKSMSLYDEIGLGNEYFVTSINSFLFNRVLREFFNSTVAIQMNDMRKMPIKVPTKNELESFKEKFDNCLSIQKQYFRGNLKRTEAREQLKPIELEIDKMVDDFYGITAKIKDEEFDDKNIETAEEEEASE